MTIQTIQLSEITNNESNPRKSFNEESIEQLAQSIKKDGILQNLIVTKNDEGYVVIAGGRRLRALHLLLENGQIENSYPVPVLIHDKQPNNDNLRIAVVENVQREQMHPLEESEAFFTLTKEGANMEEVAAQSGVSLQTIKRRLLLVNLIEESKTLYRDGEINLSQAEALAIGNEDEQKDIIKRLNDWNMNADNIRHTLLCEKPNVSMALFPREEYIGSITTDLFGENDNTYFDDVEQFFALQDEAVDMLVQEYENSTTVDWVEIERSNWFSKYSYREAEEGENGGVIILYRLDGKVEIHEELVKRENITVENTSTPKERPEFSKKAYGYFANQKTILVQNAVATNVRKAKEIAVLQRLNFSCNAVSVKLHQAVRSLSTEHMGSADAFLKLRIEAELLRLNICDDEYWYMFSMLDYDGLYASVTALSDEELDQLFALLVALSFGQETIDKEESMDSIFHQVARDLEVVTRDGWTPDEAYFKLHKKDQLLEIAEACGASIGKQFYKLKRKELIAELVTYYANNEPLQNEQQEDLKQSYCPRLMQFDIEQKED